jgi:hypothetical protein
MHKNDSAEGSNLPQRTERIIYYTKASKLLKLSSNVSGCRSAYLKHLQTSLFNLWTWFERVQDSISDKSSPKYQLFEVINPILFSIWVRTGRRF